MYQAYQLIEEAGFTVSDIRDFMNRLREGGATNMFGAGPYLGDAFGFDRHEQKEIVLQYMSNGLEEE